jgi:outer membrane lipase/esterase
MRHTLKHWLAAAALAATSLGAAAQTSYSNLFIFGDSLSDTGNIAAATLGAFPDPNQPYSAGRFSDGPVWVDYLAAGLNLPNGAVPSLLGGNNYAFGGALTGTDTFPPGLLAQLGGIHLTSPNAVGDPNALYVVVGGGNDMRDARTTFSTDSAADQLGRQEAANLAVGNIATVVVGLFNTGARHFLIANLPDLGTTPEAVNNNVVDASTDASQRFNDAISQLHTIGTQGGLDLRLLDLAGIGSFLQASAGALGITNTTEPCAGFVGAVSNTPCSASLFSDDLHPSGFTHAVFGAAALSLVTAVPEPQSVLLLGAGLALLVLRSRRRA